MRKLNKWADDITIRQGIDFRGSVRGTLAKLGLNKNKPRSSGPPGPTLIDISDPNAVILESSYESHKEQLISRDFLDILEKVDTFNDSYIFTYSEEGGMDLDSEYYGRIPGLPDLPKKAVNTGGHNTPDQNLRREDKEEEEDHYLLSAVGSGRSLNINRLPNVDTLASSNLESQHLLISTPKVSTTTTRNRLTSNPNYNKEIIEEEGEDLYSTPIHQNPASVETSGAARAGVPITEGITLLDKMYFAESKN